MIYAAGGRTLPDMHSTEERKIYGVTELTRLIRATLEEAFGEVWVEGELSNVRQPSSGHCYFTIKDENSQISAVLFRGNQRGLEFRPEDGRQVRAFGEITVYERSGNYQIIVRRLEEVGKGSLQARFEALKEKLQKEGLFEDSRKRSIPVLPRRVGVVTSPTGAAIRDILNIVTRRFPNLHLVLAPAKVQGPAAAAEIAAAIDLLNERSGFDVMIVGRGGGSLEDLWCFNEESVARAIVRSRIPVISAVGHEIDFTISDFVADLRAPTPSAAAELVVDRKDAFEEKLSAAGRQILRCLRQAMVQARSRLRAVEVSYVFREPGNLAGQYRQRLEAVRMRMRHQLGGSLRDGHQRLDAAQMRMDRQVREGIREGLQRLADVGVRTQHAITTRHRNCRQDVHRLEKQLGALSPLSVLGRGYSVTSDEKGRVIRSASEVSAGQKVVTRVEKGRFESEVVGEGSGE